MDGTDLLVSRDVSAVAPLDARAATRCPMRIHLRIDPPGPMVKADVAPMLALQFQRGLTFEAEVLAALVQHHGGDLADAGGSVQATRVLLDEGAPLLVGAALCDEGSKRVGRPDVLVAMPGRTPTGEVVYLPIDVKAHLVTSGRRSGSLGPLRAVDPTDLVGLDPGHVPEDPDRWARRNPTDQMQLAHYHRLLQASGHTAGIPWAGILGTAPDGRPVVALHDLDTSAWTSWRNVTGRWTTLQRYDHEFGFRLDVAAVAHARARGQDLDPIVTPAHSGECATCQFTDHCRPAMEQADELTLLAGVDWELRHRLGRVEGVRTRSQLAAMPHEAAATKAIAGAIDNARVICAGAGPHRARGITDLDLPRADIEVDVDMECTIDGQVYLWGALLVQRAPSASGPVPKGQYVAFSDLGPDLDDAAVFEAFWAWLQAVRAGARAAGKTFAAYCWSAAEQRYMRQYGGDRVEELIAGAEWIDLLPITRRHLCTGGAYGLKHVATAAGFAWRDQDPGGAQSMTWYADAAAGDRSAAQRLLAYNEDDVRATLAVRDWLQDAWPTLPPVQSLGP